MGYREPEKKAWCPGCKRFVEKVILALRADALYVWSEETQKYEHDDDLVDTEEPAGPARCEDCKTELRPECSPETCSADCETAADCGLRHGWLLDGSVS